MQGHNLNMMLYPVRLPTVVAYRPPLNCFGELGVNACFEAVHGIGLDEDLSARSPTVIRGALGVETEDLGAFTQRRRRVRNVAQDPGQDIPVEGVGQLQSGNKLRHYSTPCRI